MNPEIKLSVEATGRLHVVLSGSLAAISALTLRLNGRAWATLLIASGLCRPTPIASLLGPGAYRDRFRRPPAMTDDSLPR